MLGRLFAKPTEASTRPALAVIRPARVGDVSEIAILDRRAYPSDYRPREWWRDSVAAFGCHVWAAEIDRCLVGYAYAELRVRGFVVPALAVVERWRGRGVGRQLMHAVIQAVHCHCSDPYLAADVRKNNLDGQLFLRALGFRCTTIRQHDAADPMCRFVHAAMARKERGK